MNKLTAFIGKRSYPVINEIEKGAIKKFAEAIGDLNPLYIDEETARKTVHGNLIAPPTFPRIFDYGEIDGFRLPDKGLIHGEQKLIYYRPIYAGESLRCSFRVKDIYEKQGSTGMLTFFVLERTGEVIDGAPVFCSVQVLIANETVRKEMLSI